MTAPLLAVDGVSVSFNALRALTEVSFSVAAGELVALIGPNGAGKTTLLNVLAGEIAPTAGHVRFDGRALTGSKPDAVARRGLARTFQAAEPFNQLTVRENVMVGGVPSSRVSLVSCLAGGGRAALSTGELRQAADRYLATVGLLVKADAPASVLGAGQRRLLGIARILATGARMLVLDEPGAGLNEGEKAFLGGVILSLCEAGKTVLFVDHDMPLVSQIARRILVLDRGRLIADGDPDSVRSDPQVLEAYLGRRTSAPAMAAAPPPSPRAALLEIEKLSLNYGGLVALDDVSLDVGEGEIVALLGANGAGKSSLLHAVARVQAGRAERLRFGAVDLAALQTDGAVAHGISLVPEGRGLFSSLTVAQNLASGRFMKRRALGFRHLLWQSTEERAAADERLGIVYDLFPILKERADQLAGTLSGGQGQMLAIGRALMGSPRLLLLDEPSLGLAPQVIDEILSCVERLRRQGLTILLVEQNVAAALSVADRGFVLANGRVVASGAGRVLLADRRITQAYLGAPGASPKVDATPRRSVAV